MIFDSFNVWGKNSIDDGWTRLVLESEVFRLRVALASLQEPHDMLVEHDNVAPAGGAR